MKPDEIYMDYAAATPVDEAVLAAMRLFETVEFANPAAKYGAARVTRRALESARVRVADALGARPTEIVWTGGGTEGDNLAIQGVLRAEGPGAHWVTTAVEHHAVLECAEGLRRQGYECAVVLVRPNGLADPAAVAAAITDQTVLVSVQMANGEMGAVQPVAEIAKLIARVRADRVARGIARPLYLHTDATAAACYLDLHVARLGVDLLSLGASKIYGPRGAGLLYVRQGTALEPLFYGGGQERGRRAGTTDVAAAVGLATALELAQAGRASESRRLTALRDDTARRLLAAISGAVLNGDPKRRLPNNLNFTIPGAEGTALVLYLDQVGIMAGTGAACASGDLEPSRVLLALGRTRAEATNSLRLTLGRATIPTHIDRLVAELPRIVLRLREIGGN